MAKPNQILWPSRYEPVNCSVHVRNEFAMASPPETVWAWLIPCKTGQRGILTQPTSFLSGQSPDLALGTRFRWKMFGVTIESTVLEFMPCERLAWDPTAPALMLIMHGLSKKQARLQRAHGRDATGLACSTGKALRPNRME